MTEVSIILLNVNCFEKDGNKKSRVGYFLVDNQFKKDTGNYKGYADRSCYYETDAVFKKVPLSMIGKPILAAIKEVSDDFDPMKTKRLIGRLIDDKTVVDLL